jgi:hypothetical protein
MRVLAGTARRPAPFSIWIDVRARSLAARRGVREHHEERRDDDQAERQADHQLDQRQAELPAAWQATES